MKEYTFKPEKNSEREAAKRFDRWIIYASEGDRALIYPKRVAVQNRSLYWRWVRKDQLVAVG